MKLSLDDYKPFESLDIESLDSNGIILFPSKEAKLEHEGIIRMFKYKNP